MRPDFPHVFTTPARRNRDAEAHVNGRACRDLGDLDDLPRFVGMADGRRRGWNRKECARQWAALRRWLHAQVGRPWNAVWAEICAVCDPRSHTSRQVRENVDGYVEIHTHLGEDGLVRCNGAGYQVLGLHVDPRDGSLRDAPRAARARRPHAADPDRIRLDRSRELRRIGGLWFEVRFADLPEAEPRERVGEDGAIAITWTAPSAYDVLEKTTVYRRGGPRRKTRTRYACAKRALSRRELRAHGVSNDPPEAPVPGGRTRRCR